MQQARNVSSSNVDLQFFCLFLHFSLCLFCKRHCMFAGIIYVVSHRHAVVCKKNYLLTVLLYYCHKGKSIILIRTLTVLNHDYFHHLLLRPFVNMLQFITFFTSLFLNTKFLLKSLKFHIFPLFLPPAFQR